MTGAGTPLCLDQAMETSSSLSLLQTASLDRSGMVNYGHFGRLVSSVGCRKDTQKYVVGQYREVHRLTLHINGIHEHKPVAGDRLVQPDIKSGLVYMFST